MKSLKRREYIKVVCANTLIKEKRITSIKRVDKLDVNNEELN